MAVGVATGAAVVVVVLPVPFAEFDDDEQAREGRHDYLFSRSAPIYGGSYEIQRQILADRVLGMPRG